jgi:large subunit ribosomal protein L18
MTLTKKSSSRIVRHRRIRAKIIGNAERPRLALYKSNTQIIAQIIDDNAGKTLAYVASAKLKGSSPRERALAAAEVLAAQAQKQGISQVVFDRGGFRYASTISAFADAVRAAGLVF